MAFGIAALMAIFIAIGFHLIPNRTERFFELFGAVWALGFMSAILLFFLGAPGFLILKFVFQLDPPGWMVWPIGIATLAVWYNWPFRKQS
jgi:hypothetical protein